MKFLIDAQLPPALARFMTAQGENARHVLDLDMMEASDSAIWNLALRENLIIITKDEDFQIRATLTSPCPKIVWVRIGNCSKKNLLLFFDKQLEKIKFELNNGENLVELLN